MEENLEDEYFQFLSFEFHAFFKNIIRNKKF